jgi:hypothetical protein
LLVMALATAASTAFELERRGVPVVGSSSVGLASAPLSALLEGRTLGLLTVGALSIAVLASTRPLAAAEPCTSHTASGMPARAGPRRLAALAGALTLLSLALSNALGQLPLATISAILIVVSLGGIDVRRLSELRQASPRDFRIALAAAFGVTIFGLCWGVAIGVAAALGDMFRHPMPPEVSSSVANEPLGVIGARANRRYCSPMAACRGRARARAALGRPARSVRWRVDRRGARVRSARESRTSRSLATGKVRS